VIHLRIVAPADRAERTCELLLGSDSVINVVHLPGAARRPEGDLILCDVAREDASVILSDLKELGLQIDGSIAMEDIDSSISRAADEAEAAAAGSPADAVVWEEVEARTSENTELSASYLTFMVLATLLASCGVFLDSEILIVGAMVVGPEFGPIAGFCVAAVERRGSIAARSALALAVGFPLAMTAAFVVALALKEIGLAPDGFGFDDRHPVANAIANPDFFSFFVAALAGIAGVISLTTAKSGALIGVLISVTTIPAAAAVAVSAAYDDGEAWRGSMAQLAANLAMLLISGTATLYLQRLLYRRRRVKHLSDEARAAAGLPVGRSRRSSRGSTRSRPWS
jgi:uncharacterized hydrophobic protein (TIGR00271 family)